jgi:hypothetical protein
MRSNKKNFKFLLSNLEYSAVRYNKIFYRMLREIEKKTAACFWLKLYHKKKLREKSPKFKCPAPSKEPVKKGQGQNTLLYQLKTFWCGPEIKCDNKTTRNKTRGQFTQQKQMEMPHTKRKVKISAIGKYYFILQKKLLKRFAVIQNLSQLQENATI